MHAQRGVIKKYGRNNCTSNTLLPILRYANSWGGVRLMMLKKNKLLLFWGMLLTSMSVQATSEDDDFSSFLESLFSGEGDGDDSFSNLFKPTQKTEKKTNPTEQKIIALTIEEKTTFQQKLNALLSPLGKLIKQMHSLDPVFGGTMYPQIVTHKALFFKTESTLLTLESLFTKLSSKELNLFTQILDAQEKALISSLSSVAKLAQKTAPAGFDIDAENDFIMGKKITTLTALTPAEQKKILSALNEIKPKLTTFEGELQKILVSPEIKRLFPEQPAANIKPGSAPRVSSYNSNSSHPYGSSSAKDSRYSSRSPYGNSRDYGYDYDDYDDYDNYNPHAAQNTESTEPKDPEKEQKQKGLMPPEKDKSSPENTHAQFIQKVNSFMADSLVAYLQTALESGSMNSNHEYFEQLTSIFEGLFAKDKDGIFLGLEKTLKNLEKHYEPIKKFLEEKKTSQNKIKIEDWQSKATDESASLKNEPSIEELQEAANDYEQTKQGLATAALRLYNLPTPHYVTPSAEDEAESEPVKKLMLPTKSVNISEQNRLCQKGQDTLKKFITFLETKVGLKSYISTQQTHLDGEIQQLENSRIAKVSAALAELSETELQKTATLTILQKRIAEIEKLGKVVNILAPTPKSLALHFAKPSSTPTRSDFAASEQLTSQERILKELEALSARITTQEQKSSPEDKKIIEKIKQTIERTKTAWNPLFTEVSAAAQSEDLAPEQPSRGIKPSLLPRLLAQQPLPQPAPVLPDDRSPQDEPSLPPIIDPKLARAVRTTTPAQPEKQNAAPWWKIW